MHAATQRKQSYSKLALFKRASLYSCREDEIGSARAVESEGGWIRDLRAHPRGVKEKSRWHLGGGSLSRNLDIILPLRKDSTESRNRKFTTVCMSHPFLSDHATSIWIPRYLWYYSLGHLSSWWSGLAKSSQSMTIRRACAIVLCI
jgi:hypothetical protein